MYLAIQPVFSDYGAMCLLARSSLSEGETLETMSPETPANPETLFPPHRAAPKSPCHVPGWLCFLITAMATVLNLSKMACKSFHG